MEEMVEFTTISIPVATREKLRRIADLTERRTGFARIPLYAVLDQLLDRRLEELQDESKATTG